MQRGEQRRLGLGREAEGRLHGHLGAVGVGERPAEHGQPVALDALVERPARGAGRAGGRHEERGAAGAVDEHAAVGDGQSVAGRGTRARPRGRGRAAGRRRSSRRAGPSTLKRGRAELGGHRRDERGRAGRGRGDASSTPCRAARARAARARSPTDTGFTRHAPSCSGSRSRAVEHGGRAAEERRDDAAGQLLPEVRRVRAPAGEVADVRACAARRDRRSTRSAERPSRDRPGGVDEARDLRWAPRHRALHLRPADQAGLDHGRLHHEHRGLEPDHAHRGGGPLAALRLRRVRGVVGGDRVDRTVGERGPEDVRRPPPSAAAGSPCSGRRSRARTRR